MATGYGKDLWSDSRGINTARYATGKTLLAQAMVNRLSTRRGTLSPRLTSGAYGLDITDWVGSVSDDVAEASLPEMIRAELLKDDRVADVSVSLARAAVNGGLVSFTISIYVTALDPGSSFQLTLGVSAVGLDVLGVK